jgi:altronate dehydratase large subunit
MTQLNPVPKTFLGFPRPDGRVGTRNHVLVIPSSPLVLRVVEQVQVALPDAICIYLFEGVGEFESSTFALETLARFAASANVYSVVVVGVTDDDPAQTQLLATLATAGTPVQGVTLSTAGGFGGAVEAVVRLAELELTKAASVQREPMPLSALILGTECGGSDAYSGLTANPALGFCSDRVVAAGGTAILAEIPELIGAEHLLVERAISAEVGSRLKQLVHSWEQFALEFAEDVAKANPSPGNIRSGITTLAEKSLGCIRKGGTTPLVDVVGFGERSQQQGLVVMNTDGDDVAELVGLAAGGANVIVFTTGMGTPVGSPIVPTVKLSSNTPMAKRLPDVIDLDAGPIAEGKASVAEMGDVLLRLIIEVASGRQTRAEQLRQRDFALPPTGPSA